MRFPLTQEWGSCKTDEHATQETVCTSPSDTYSSEYSWPRRKAPGDFTSGLRQKEPVEVPAVEELEVSGTAEESTEEAAPAEETKESTEEAAPAEETKEATESEDAPSQSTEPAANDEVAPTTEAGE